MIYGVSTCVLSLEWEVSTHNVTVWTHLLYYVGVAAEFWINWSRCFFREFYKKNIAVIQSMWNKCMD